MTVRSHLTRSRLRIVFFVLIVLSIGVLGYAFHTGISTANPEDVPRAEPRDGHTVVTESARAGTIIAYEPDGSLLYYNNTRTKYFDVDPVEGEELTVEYAATDTISTSGSTCDDPPCTRNVIERANLSTGEVEVIYERYDYKEFAGEWHDHIRLNETHILIADIVADQVFIVNTETEIVEWLWDAQSEFPVQGGGPYPSDWAHINDVEYIESGELDGHIMVSLRNQDQVVFIDPGSGVNDRWTLGSEDDYSVMFEQHNPDYIPESNGGPAVVVSDSENGRVQEFQRVDGSWNRTWEWSDERMQWPRDADRLPNGNTLIADSHGKRVFEVTPEGEIEWEVPSTMPYEVERLETGDESTGGQSAVELDLQSQTEETASGDGLSPLGYLAAFVQWVLPHRIFNGILFVSPAWMGRPEFLAATVGITSTIAWGGAELRWWLGSVGIGIRSPLYLKQSDE
ncbi:MAG: aryl-sulfate sulfotransferase [Natronomonas sp.]